jgi:hypothetical protein
MKRQLSAPPRVGSGDLMDDGWAQAGTAAQTELAPCMPGTGWPPFTPGARDAKTRGMPTREGCM